MHKLNIFALLLITATNVGAGEALNNIVDQSLDRATSHLNKSAENSTRNYLSNYFPTVEVQVDLINRESPSTGILVVVPLSNPNDLVNTFFNQSSIYQKNRVAL